MKFGKIMLRASSVSEAVVKPEDWVNYKQLKKRLRKMQARRDDPTFDLQGQEREFFRAIAAELQKVDATYAVLKGKAFNNVENALVGSSSSSATCSTPEQCTELHLMLLLVENFAVLNYCGFSKILKKHDKVMERATRDKFLARHVVGRPFHQLQDLRDNISRVEAKFAQLVGLTEESVASSSTSTTTTTTTTSGASSSNSATSMSARSALDNNNNNDNDKGSRSLSPRLAAKVVPLMSSPQTSSSSSSTRGTTASSSSSTTSPVERRMSKETSPSKLSAKHASMVTLRSQVNSIKDEEGRRRSVDEEDETSSSSDEELKRSMSSSFVRQSTASSSTQQISAKRPRPSDSTLLLSLADVALRSPALMTTASSSSSTTAAQTSSGARTKRLRSATPETPA